MDVLDLLTHSTALRSPVHTETSPKPMKKLITSVLQATLCDWHLLSQKKACLAHQKGGG